MSKVQIKSYVFDASAQTVTFTDYATIDLDSILVITNVTLLDPNPKVIYNFATFGKGGSVATNVLTLEYDTTAMADTDKLQIWYWDEDIIPALESGGNLDDINNSRISNVISSSFDMTDISTYAEIPDTLGATTAIMKPTGTWTGQISIQVSFDASGIWYNVILTDWFTRVKLANTYITSNQIVIADISGAKTVRAKVNATGIGTATISLTTITNSSTILLGREETLASIDTKLTGPVPISGTFWQATQPVSGPLTDTQLRATAVPISGTVTANTGLTQPLTDTQLRATAVPVSGTFWQATQPVSGPLTDAQLRATAVPVSGTISTGLTQPLTDTQLRATAVPVSGTFWQATQPISGTITANAGTNLNTSALALESGGNLELLSIKDFATSAKQDTGNASLSDIAAYSLASLDRLTDIKNTDGIKKITDALPAGSAIIGKFGIDQTTPGTTNKVSIGTDGVVAISAGSAVIGHVIADTGSTTAVTGNVTIIQGTASNLHVAATLDAETTKVIGTINIAAAQTIAVTNTGTFAVQSASTLSAETTKVIGVVRNSDGAGNLLTSNSTTYTAKFGLDSNLLGTLGTAFSTAGKVDVKAADGDVFVRQATASNLNATVVGTGTFVTQSTLAAETTKIIGTVNIAASQTIAVTNTGTFAVQSTPVTQADTFMLGGVNVKEINAVAPLMGSGIMGTGSLRVTIASDNDALTVKQSTATNLKAEVVGTGTFVTQSTLAAETTKVIGTVNIAGSQTIAVTNTGTFAVQSAATLAAETTKVIGTVNIASGQTVALAAGSAAIGKLTANTGVIIGDVNVVNSNVSTNVAQINGVTPLMGNGATGTGSPRVTIANDNTDIPTKSVPQTSGGLTTYHLVSAGTTNATVIKNGIGQVYGWYIYNNAVSMRKVAFHDASSTPTAGASIFFSLSIPGNSAANVLGNIGIPFATGISITTVTNVPDSGSSAVTANDLNINIFYK